ncbi:transposase, partial [Deinococcus saxicola]|uniref:transposase n=1 Tax=Deinococcus saxicola TaxID=249406 RepID=UPI0039EF843D
MYPKETRSRRLYSDILPCFSRRQHRESFEVFLDLLLDGSGRPLPERATVKSPSALSRFLNHATWNTRQLCRVMRQHAFQTLQDRWRQQPHQRPRLELLVDLTSLEKTGKFAELADWMHTYHSVHGVHLVVLYLCCGELRLPWAFQVWRGKGTPSPAQLALKLLRTVPSALLLVKRRSRLHADGGFESTEFIQGVLGRGLDIVVGVRCNRKLEDGRQMRDLMVRGSLVKPCGLDQAMCVSWVWLYRNKEPEQRFVMSNLDLGGKYLARVGKRRWRIEAFFKTVKGRFGLERFAQHSKQGVLRWWCLSGLAFLLCHLQDLDLPLRLPHTWPDWGNLARIVRFSFVPDVHRRALQLELDALDAFQHASLALII